VRYASGPSWIRSVSQRINTMITPAYTRRRLMSLKISAPSYKPCRPKLNVIKISTFKAGCVIAVRQLSTRVNTTVETPLM